MELLDRTAVYGRIVEHADLNEICRPKAENCGLMLCYALAVNETAPLWEAELLAEDEDIGVGRRWVYRTDGATFLRELPTVEAFLARFDREDFGKWTLELGSRAASISVSGTRDDTVIGISYPKEKQSGILRLLAAAEDQTYVWHDKDPAIVGVLQKDYGLSLRRAVDLIGKLQRQPDIYRECAAALPAGETYAGDDAAQAEGFTARRLRERYPLSPLGAYDFLVDLREEPQKTLNELKDARPRK